MPYIFKKTTKYAIPSFFSHTNPKGQKTWQNKHFCSLIRIPIIQFELHCIASPFGRFLSCSKYSLIDSLIAPILSYKNEPIFRSHHHHPMESSSTMSRVLKPSSSPSPIPSFPVSGNISPVSVFSESSRIGTKYPSPVSYDPSVSIVNPKSGSPQGDLPIVPLPPTDPTADSVGNLSKRLLSIRVAVENEVSDGDSSREKWRSGDDGVDISSMAVSPYLPSSAKLRSCDVYIGLPGSKPDLLRFSKWLRAELELQGVSCFAADRSRCKVAVGHSIAERAMSSATFGVVIVSKRSFSNPYSMYELRSFLDKKNLVPVFFGLGPTDCMGRDIVEKEGELWENDGGDLWKGYGGVEKEWKQVVDALSRMDDWKLVAQSNNWRDCISEAIILLGTRLGKWTAVEKVQRWKERVKEEEFPFPRNDRFVGRKKELLELELMLFGDINGDGEKECLELKNVPNGKNATEGSKSKRRTMGVENKGKQPAAWKESEEVIRMEKCWSTEKDHHLQTGKKAGKKAADVLYGKGVACVSGERGMGKTELLLEFAYRFSQRYRMVLWLGGEARYIRQNFMDIMCILEIDVNIENQLSRSFEELEEEAIRRVRKEFMRDIPFLIVIDNLESEEDWWDAKNVMELLPHFGGETHTLVSTRLHCVLNLEPLRLSHLSGADSISLMKGRCSLIPSREVDALRVIEEKVRRLTFGLALVGGILSEFSINPRELLEAMGKIPDRLFGEEDHFFRHNPFLVQLIEVCFSFLDEVDVRTSKLALASGWFAPSPIPLSLLASTSSKALEKHGACNFLIKFVRIFTLSQSNMSEEESSTTLVNLGLARNATKQGYIDFHDIIRMYARKRGNTKVAYGMVQAINSKGCLPQHNDHIWAACFLLLKFGADPAILNPKASEVVSFIKRLALPLALSSFTNFARCNAASELLRLCISALDGMDDSFLSQMDDEAEKPRCWGNSSSSTRQLGPGLYQESALLKATLLETRAVLMLQGGDYDVAGQLCRTAISIREVYCGWDHPETVSACNTMARIVRAQAHSHTT